MSKKPFLFIGLLSVLLVITGLILSPTFVGKFTSDGKITSVWAIIDIWLLQIFAVVLGGVITMELLLIIFLPEKWLSTKEKRLSLYFWGVCIIGLAIIITGIILEPSLIEKELNLQGRIGVDIFSKLYFLRLLIMTLGCLIVFISIIIIGKKSLGYKKSFRYISLPVVLLLYFVVIYTFYINEEYPGNILLKSGTFSRVSDLLLGREILLSDFAPRSPLKVHRTKIYKAKYPVIDFHFHLTSDFLTEEDKKTIAPDALIKSMDSVGVKMIVGMGEKNELENYEKRFPDRFDIFFNVLLGSGSYRVFTNEFLASLPDKLQKNVQMGMKGIGEFPKDLGLKIYDSSGKLLRIDDPRLDPLYEKAGELGVPFVWHATDPTAFFERVDRFNERFIELGRYPQWSYYGNGCPSKETVLKELENVVRKHPNTIIVGAHFDWMTDDLNELGRWLDKYPNYYVEFGTILSELGRQPYTTRKFFIKYQDKILFGTDGGALFTKGWTVAKFYRAYFEFLETDDEYIDYPLKGAINQGNWEIYGIDLPDTVLQKIYYKNAEKILKIKNN